MAKREPRSLTTHHKYFAAGSALLLISTVWVFYNDHFQREYPAIQENYDLQEKARLEGEREEVQKELKRLQIDEAELEEHVKRAEVILKENQTEIANHQAEMGQLKGILDLLLRHLNFAGTDYDVRKYEYSVGQATLEQVEKQGAIRRELFNLVEKLQGTEQVNKDEVAVLKKYGMTLEEGKYGFAYHQKIINKYQEELEGAKKALASFHTQRDDLNRALQKIEGNPVLNIVKDFPGLDIPGPRRTVEQVVLPQLPVSVNFAMTQRVDRCVTCHKGIDNPDPKYDPKNTESKVDRVLRAHPRLDLFVGSNSKHSYKQFGCTVCHSGRHMGVTFLRSGHTPRDQAQAERWRTQYGWDTLDQHKPGQPLWEFPMLPLQYVESSCIKCHRGVDRVPEAAKLNQGRELFRENGCANCHTGGTDADQSWLGRIGPDLRRLGEKTDPAWARRWIQNPWEFRPSTKMPRFFGLENRASDELANPSSKEQVHARDPVEIEAIATYLFTTSKLREHQLPAPPEGDRDKGKQLFERVGCLGCHSTAEAKTKYTLNDHGPDLSRIGEKIKPAWLFQWLKHPHQYWPESRMPSLRLNDEEAANLTAYLIKTMRVNSSAPKWEGAPGWSYDALIRDLLGNTTPEFALEQYLANPDSLIREELKSRVRYETKPGSQTRVDSGQGEWTEQQIEAVLQYLNETTGSAAEKNADRDRVKKAFFAGQKLIQHYGCFGCHNIQGWTYSPLTCVNLSGEADKDITKFDFGFTPIAKNRWEWFYLKITRPRVFDIGKEAITKPLDRLRMPWFGFQRDTVPTAAGAHAGHASIPSELQRSASGGESGKHGDLTATGNPDQDGGAGFTHAEVEALVTHLLSLTNETIPLEMRKQPSARDLAIDRGERVIRALNCTGCHLIGVEKPAFQNQAAVQEEPDLSKRGRIPLEALLTSEAQDAMYAQGVYSDRDEFSLDDASSGATAFLNFGRGTYLTKHTLRVLLGEKLVRRSPSESWQRIGFQFLKERDYQKLRKEKDRWVPYGELVPEARFLALTAGIFSRKGTDGAKVYQTYAGQYVNVDAFERLSGTQAFVHASEDSAHHISKFNLQKLKADGKTYEPAEVLVRWTSGEGRINPHMMKIEEGQQQAPPSLAFEGGKVQPDWLYGFLRNVQPLRPTLNIRMPSFFTQDEEHSYKQVYSAGRFSGVNPETRPMGINGEPQPGPDAPPWTLDDAKQLVEYFDAIAGEGSYGFQSSPVVGAEQKALYERGYRLHFPPGVGEKNKGGMSCTSCHSVGKFENPTAKGPNLAFAMRRFKEPWLHRFLTFPQGIYPWTVMPSNFFEWGSLYRPDPSDSSRGLSEGNEVEFKAKAEKIKAMEFFLRHAGDGEIGSGEVPGQ